jgi:hypothetical protein
LASGSLAVVIWYLIERACFSAISAASRSPTIRCGSCWRFTAVAMISSLRVGVAGPATRGGGLHAEQLQPAHGLQDLRTFHHMAS